MNPERKHFFPETARIREELGAVCYVSVRGDERGVERWGGRKKQAKWSIPPSGDQRLGIPRAPENECYYSGNQRPEPENLCPATKCESTKLENIWVSGGGRSGGPAIGAKRRGGRWVA